MVAVKSVTPQTAPGALRTRIATGFFDDSRNRRRKREARSVVNFSETVLLNLRRRHEYHPGFSAAGIQQQQRPGAEFGKT